MRRAVIFVAFLIWLIPALSPAVEITSLRATNGPLGLVRSQTKFLANDAIYLTFDIADLKVDKEGRATFAFRLEVYDSANKRVYGQDTPPATLHLLGSKKLPWQAFVFLDPTWVAGKYQIRLTVADREANTTKTGTYDFELLPATFGLVQPAAPAVTFTGLDMQVSFAVVGWKRDKDKMPDVSLKFQVKDPQGKGIFANPLTSNLKELHQEGINDLTKQTIVAMKYPLFPTRAGTFTVEIEAHDKISNETRTLRFPLTVLDAATYTGK